MKNMGRLFQYNRFGDTSESNKKDNLTRNHLKAKERQNIPAKCPAYSELYSEYNKAITSEANAASELLSSPSSAATTANATAAAATKSVELAIKKYQQWSSKFLSPMVTATATTTAPTTDNFKHLSATTSSTSSSNSLPVTTTTTTTSTSTSSSSSAHSYICTLTSGYHSNNSNNSGVSGNRKLPHEHDDDDHNDENDREMLVVAADVAANKKPKVYDCMRDFLRRAFFQQHQQQQEQADEEAAATGEEKAKRIQNVTTEKCVLHTEDEDVTSDYDELDILDTSYNADEEDATDCSSTCSYTNECSTDEVADADDDNEVASCTMAATNRAKVNGSPLKSMLSLNCWQHSSTTDSTTEEEEEKVSVQHILAAEDSDAGISDCCQLINEKQSTMRKSQKHKTKYRHNISDNEDELLQSAWYQPRITTKATLERLQQAQPGCFLVRRKARTFQLCLRAANKVKNFTVITTTSDNYKLKGARKEFTSLKALVTHHSVMAEQLPVTLTLPREKQLQSAFMQQQRYADDFDTFESLQILGILKSLQAKSFGLS